MSNNQVPNVTLGAAPPVQQSLPNTPGLGQITAGTAAMAMVYMLQAMQLILSIFDSIMQQKNKEAEMQGQAARSQASAIGEKGNIALGTGIAAGLIGIGTAAGGFGLSMGKMGGNAIKTQQSKLNDLQSKEKTLSSLSNANGPPQRVLQEGTPEANRHQTIRDNLKSGNFESTEYTQEEAVEVFIATRHSHPEDFAMIRAKVEEKTAQNLQQQNTAAQHLRNLHDGRTVHAQVVSNLGQSVGSTINSGGQAGQAYQESNAALYGSTSEIAKTQVQSFDQMSEKEYQNAMALLRVIKELENADAAAKGSIAG